MTYETEIGGVYSSDTLLTLAKSPYAVTSDLTVLKGTTLTIESGVDLNFQARVRLVVNGTLKAVASSRDRIIIMRHNATVGVDSAVLRLVGGATPREGRIEVYDASSMKWGTVCDDFWNRNNAKVVCRHLGFNDPIGSDYGTKRFGAGTGDIGLSNVDCDGVENSLLDCRAQKWNNSNCVHREDVGVVCGEGSVGFWGGITFESEGAKVTTSSYGVMDYSTSSVMQNVQIFNAGIVPDTVRRSTPDANVAAIRATSAVAKMTNVTILDSRLSGIQLNDIHADIDFEAVTVLNCSGTGLYGQSSRRLTCLRCHLENCTQGGISITRIPFPIGRPTVSVPSHDFSYSGSMNGGKKSYFVDDEGVYFNFTTANRYSRYYYRVLETSPGYGLSVSFHRFLISGRGCLRVINGDTGYSHLGRCATSSNADNVTADYHQLVMSFEPYYWYTSSLTGDIKAYVSRYRLDSRQVNLLDCSTIHSVSGYGLRVQGSLGSLLVAGHKAIDNGQGGIQISGNGYSVQIDTSVVQYGVRDYNYNYGINLNGYFSVMTLSKSRVSDHRYGVYWYSNGAGNMTMMNNILNGSRTDSGRRYIYAGLYLRSYEPYTYGWRLTKDRAISFEGNVVTRVGTSQQSSYAMHFYAYHQYGYVGLFSVRNNVFSQNGGGFYYDQDFYLADESAIFSGNRFEENDVGSISNVVELSANHKGRVIIEGNTFVRNKGKSIVLLSPETYFNSGVQVRNIAFFRNNTLKNNVVYNETIASKTFPNCVLEVTRSVNVEVYHNVFDNPGSSYDVGNGVEVTSSLDRINFTLNYWGTDNELIIQNRIFDFDDSSFLATLEYFPFLLSADPSDVAGLSHPRQYPLFVTPSGEVGGRLNDSVTLTAASSPYLITRDVTILPTGSLSIEAGVVIEVKANTGILVEGSMSSLGSSVTPVTFREQSVSSEERNDSVFRITDGYVSEWYEYGTLQINFDQAWRSICLPSNVSRDYTSLDKLADLACKRLGYNRGYFDDWYYFGYYHEWYPSLETPIITRFSCPSNATDTHHCTFTSGQYSASTRCLEVYHIDCYDLVALGNNRQFGGWAGIRFSPMSTVPVSGSSHALPSSVLQHTLIQGAGRWRRRNFPSVRAILKSPTFVNVTIKDSASTALSFQYLHEEVNITGVTVDGGRGDGISFYGPRTRNLTFHGITIRNIAGSGIRMYPSSSSLPGLTNYQSICSVPAVLNVRVDKGTYFGLHQDDHFAGIYCSVELRGPPNTVLSLTLVSVQLYNDDRLVFRNGSSSSSPAIATYSGQNTNSIDDSLLSSVNSVFVEITTGSKSSAPGFALYSVALSTKPGRSITRVNDVSMFSVGTGISFSSTNDDVFISNARVENSSNNGIYSSSHYGFYSLRNSVIRHSRSRGLYMSSLRGHIEILNNEVTGSLDHGIYIHDSYDRYQGVIDSNRLSNSGNSGLYLYGYHYNQWNVTRNVFDSNKDGVSVNSNSGSSHLTISENLFSGQTRYGLIFDRSLNALASIDGNTFVGHRGSTGGAMLLQGTAESLSVTRNVFHSNSGKYVVKLSPYDFTTSPFLFQNNRLLNNTVNSTELYAVDYGHPAVAVVSMSSRITMENNEFNNPESQFELGIQLPVQSSSELSVNVSRNYWGTADEAAIRDRIMDFGYCSRLGNAEFFPYLTSPSGPAVSLFASRDTSILRPNSVLRGRVSTSTTIPISGSPYTVVGDITVLPGQTLTVEAGVELRFTANTGIMVEGRLLAQGTKNLPIKFVDNSLVIRSSSSVGSSVGNIRLVGAVAHEGVAEIFYNGTWGTLCALQDDDDIYRTNHNYYLSDVVCGELGYSGVNWWWQSSRYMNSSYPRDAWLEHLICRGSESVLAQCVNYVFQRSKCHLGALHVSCWTGNNNQALLKQQQSWLHWSGVRFSRSLQQPSVMSHVFLSGAGYVNAERIAAIQVVGHRLLLTDVSVTKNAWTGVEFLNSPAPNITKLDLSLNEGTGLRLSNTLSCLLEEVTAIENRGHGLALTSGGFLQSLWNYPIVSPVDICSQSGKFSASTPFYLRFVPKLMTRKGYNYQNCRVDIQADPNHVLSFDILAIQFQEWGSRIVIDDKTIFSSRSIQSLGDSLHYVTKGNSSYVSTYSKHYYSSFDPRKNFVLIYVQQHSISKSSCLH